MTSPAASDWFTARGIIKDYAVRVLHQVDFAVQAGEIHGLLGANGAGKSTLCKIIAGLVSPTNGSMTWRGADYAPLSKRDAEQRGVQMVQQELNLIPTLSVAENLFFHQLPGRLGIIRRRELQRRSEELLQRYGLSNIDPRMMVDRLGVGQQQMLEIARVLARNCQLLILDEPTAALSHGEIDRLFTWLRGLQQTGVGIVYISHRLAEVQQITTRATFLRDGRNVGTYATAELDRPGCWSCWHGQMRIHLHWRLAKKQLLR